MADLTSLATPSCGPGLIPVAFDAAHPAAAAWAKAHAAQLIVEVTHETKAAVRAIIARVMREGLSVQQAAPLIRTIVGLTERQANAVLTLQLRLFAQGLRPGAVDRRITTYAKRLHRQRSLLIARTETARAVLEGQRQLWLQARADGLITDAARRQWSTTPDEITCEVCGPMQGARAPIDDDTWTRTDGSVVALELPAHPSCRCAATLLVQPAAADLRQKRRAG